MENIELLKGDCLELMKRIPNKSINLIVTDPPYWHKKSPGKPYSERNQCKTSSKFSNSSLYNQDNKMMKGMSDFDDNCINDFLTEAVRTMSIPNIYLFCSEQQVPYYCLWAEKNKLMFSILVWRKPLSIINKNRFSQNIEYIVRIYNYGTGLNRIDLNYYYDRVKDVKPISGSRKHHPTEKPVEIMKQFIELSSQENDVILDPFMGSGSTGVAAVNTNRKFIGMELDENYFNIAQERINKAIKEKQETLF